MANAHKVTRDNCWHWPVNRSRAMAIFEANNVSVNCVLNCDFLDSFAYFEFAVNQESNWQSDQSHSLQIASEISRFWCRPQRSTRDSTLTSGALLRSVNCHVNLDNLLFFMY